MSRSSHTWLNSRPPRTRSHAEGSSFSATQAPLDSLVKLARSWQATCPRYP